MKKDLIYAPLLIVTGSFLGLLDITGLPVHIILSVVGLALLIAYTVQTKKEWKIPALEIGMRVAYGLALISGIAIVAGCPTAGVAMAHKVLALVFSVLLLVLFITKLIKKNK